MKAKSSGLKVVMIITIIILGLMTALVVLNNMQSDANNHTSFDKQPPIEGQPVLGEPDAPVTVVEFGDFKCPACKAWGESVFPALINDYVETGKVKFSYVNVLFHGEESQLGSLAAESIFKQNPDTYWDFHQELFKEQPSQNHDALWITPDKMLEIAKKFPSIDVEKLKVDLEQQSAIEEVQKDSKLVEEYKVEQTPSIMVNGTMLEDPFDYEEMKSLIEEELEGKE